jgi:hydroxymethylpyrimidine/phosphomethylpyrimidine kinase
MLASAGIARVVRRFLADHPAPVVLDPVMVATCGDPLVDTGGDPLVTGGVVEELRRFLPNVSILTPNLTEAACLLGEPVAPDVATMRQQTSRLRMRGARRVLLKGGHLLGPAVDVYAGPEGVIELHAERVATRNTHGTGCALSSAIAALRPRRAGWVEAVHDAKTWLTGAIAAADQLTVGTGRGPIHHAHRQWRTMAPTDPVPAAPVG